MISRKKILVVDDEPVVLRTMALVLGRRFDVLLANNVDDALLQMSEEKDGVGIVVTDYDMPNGNGEDLAVAIRCMYPEVAIILNSGRHRDDIENQDLFDGIVNKVDSSSLMKLLEII